MIRYSTKIKSWLGVRCTESSFSITQKKPEYRGADAEKLAAFILKEDNQKFYFQLFLFSQ